MNNPRIRCARMPKCSGKVKIHLYWQMFFAPNSSKLEVEDNKQMLKMNFGLRKSTIKYPLWKPRRQMFGAPSTPSKHA